MQVYCIVGLGTIHWRTRPVCVSDGAATGRATMASADHGSEPAVRAHNCLLVRSALESEVLQTAMVLTAEHLGRAGWESATRVTARTKRILLRFILWSNGPCNQMDPIVDDDNKIPSSCGCAPRIIIIIILGKLRLRGLLLVQFGLHARTRSSKTRLLDQSGATGSTFATNYE